MKKNDLLLIGGAAAAYYFFIYKKEQQAAAAQGGSLFNLDLSGLGGLWDSLFGWLQTGPKNLQESIAANKAAETEKRWYKVTPKALATTMGFTTWGEYSQTALQANPTLLPAGATMGAQVAILAGQTGATPYGGALPGQTGAASVGTIYTAKGGAAPVLIVPTSNFGGKGADLYTTLDVAIGQKAAIAGATTPPSPAQLASLYARGLV